MTFSVGRLREFCQRLLAASLLRAIRAKAVQNKNLNARAHTVRISKAPSVNM